MGAVTEVAAITLELGPVLVIEGHGLVDIVPDEAALVAGFCCGKVRVFLQISRGISHRMGVFAVDIGLVSHLGKALLNLGNRIVHGRDHVRGLGIAGVVVHALVVDKAVGIERPEEVCLVPDHGAPVGFVPAGPDQNRRMVLVPFIHGPGPVEDHTPVVLPVAGNGVGIPSLFLPDGVPDAVGFHICLINNVEPQDVRQPVEGRLVRVMGSADGVDIVPLHRN